MDQPLKKRRLIEAAQESSRSKQPSSNSLSSSTPEEGVQKRKNRDELRKLHDCYKRIRFYLSRNGSRLKHDSDQAYLYLITASKGCSSVQRIVAELIPRYASVCPKSLEAAAKVVIDMHNCSIGVINRREDFDGVAYQIAKACILGLVDICCTASSEASISSISQEICAAVFSIVFRFLISTLEKVEIHSVGSCAIEKLQQHLDLFHELIQGEEGDDKPGSFRLFRFRALSLLKILFSCPRDILGACFELMSSTSTDVGHYKKGLYFINQVTTQFNEVTVKQVLDRHDNKENSIADPDEIDVEDIEMDNRALITTTKGIREPLCPQSTCFLKMVIFKEPSLRGWILIKWKGLQNVLQPEAFEGLSQLLERVFGSSVEILQDSVTLQAGVDNMKSSRKRSHHDKPTDLSFTDHVSNSNNVTDACAPETNTEKHKIVSFEALRTNISKLESKSHRAPLDEGENIEGSVLNENFGTSRRKESVPKTSLCSFASPVSTKLQNDHSSLEKVFPGLNYGTTTVINSGINSHGTGSGQIFWYFDGDPSAMDVFSASKQLWISSLGCDASESVVRLQFEDFGPVKHFYFFGDQDFAMIEYRNIMDAIRAREFMGGSSPWGACLQVKFLDSGLGSNGESHGVAIGHSCHVYIGKILNQHSIEELIQDLVSSGLNGPRTVTDISDESALIEFSNAEQAALAMEHIRKRQKEMNSRESSSSLLSNRDSKFSGNSISKKENISVKDCVTSQLPALFSSICTRFGVKESDYYHLLSKEEDDQGATNTLFISFAHIVSQSFDDELRGFCSFAAGKAGSVVKVERLNLQSPYWMVEFNCADAAVEALRNIRSCPCISLHVTFRNPAIVSPLEEQKTSERFNPLRREEKTGTRQHASSLLKKTQSNMKKEDSLRVKVENTRPKKQKELSLRSKPQGRSSAERMETDLTDVQHVASDGRSYAPSSGLSRGLAITPPPIQSMSYAYPVLTTPCSSWDSHSVKQPLQVHQNPSGNNLRQVPFLVPSVTPLAQLPGKALYHLDQMAGAASTTVSHPLPLPPPPPPPSQPPFVPPPPSSPPPAHRRTSSETSLTSLWRGSLSKSGVQYCTVYSSREKSEKSKYSGGLSEPTSWPSKLDVMQRTALRHVKTTFSNAQSHKREVCRLLPAAASDVKGLRGFASYLKERECAGVIKLAAGKTIWARVLFILPNSPEVCTMLAISPDPSDSLIALVLPKDTSVDST